VGALVYFVLKESSFIATHQTAASSLPRNNAYIRTTAMTSLSQEELDGIYAFAVDLGKQAGQMLTDAAQIRIDGGDATSEQKENAVDLVTETDEGRLPHEIMHFQVTDAR
jgi:hypothetical protein